MYRATVYVRYEKDEFSGVYNIPDIESVIKIINQYDKCEITKIELDLIDNNIANKTLLALATIMDTEVKETDTVGRIEILKNESTKKYEQYFNGFRFKYGVGEKVVKEWTREFDSFIEAFFDLLANFSGEGKYKIKNLVGYAAEGLAFLDNKEGGL